jgi:glycosyltransferase involved in cell wall biosynthesis
MNPTVTIGMCVYNGEKTLALAICSIIRQDFPHHQMELVFVDDGSQDASLKIISEYVSKMDIKTRVFKTKWQGVGPARNLIVNCALGNYILWVDSDEVLTPNYVKKQVQFMNSHPDVGITSGLVKLVPENLILNLELVPDALSRLHYGKPRSFLWKTDKMPGTGASTFRITALREVEGFDESIVGAGEDQDVAKRMQTAGWLIKYNEAEFYEFHGGLKSFRDLWKKYLWYGYGCHRIFCRDRRIFSLPRMSIMAGFATGFFYSLIAYKVFHQKVVFLLPVHYSLKLTAWMFGFMKAQIRVRQNL